MKSLTEQLDEAVRAERAAEQECETISTSLFVAEQIVNNLQADLRRASARHKELQAERRRIEASRQRERLFQNGSGR